MVPKYDWTTINCSYSSNCNLRSFKTSTKQNFSSISWDYGCPGGASEADLEAEEAEDEVQVQEGESLEDIKAKLKPKKSTISADMLDTANTYDDKVAVIRMIVGDEAGKVSNVFRQLMKKMYNNLYKEYTDG